MSYTWKLSTNPCTQCIGLSTQPHPTKPSRPHPLCQCTFIRFAGGGGASNCEENQIQISAITYVGATADYPQYPPLESYENHHLVHEYDVQGICPDGSVVEVNLTVEVTGEKLQEMVDKLNKEWDEGGSGANTSAEMGQHTTSEATQKAMSEFENLCPDCPADFIGV